MIYSNNQATNVDGYYVERRDRNQFGGGVGEVEVEVNIRLGMV